MARRETIRILVVDDEAPIRRLLEKELSAPHREVTPAENAKAARAAISSAQFDVIVLDLRLPDANGLDLMMEFRELIPGVEVILITGYGDINNAVEAMKMSAYDYIPKPFDLDRLELVIEKAYQRVRLQRENRLLRHNQNPRASEKLIGKSPGVDNVRYLISKVAPTHVPVLITGESGTGKNVVSRAIHSQSQRADHPLITKNCGTLQKELIRSELFGYHKGAFTGAEQSRDGLIALAHKGTLFLDEIGELPGEVQSSLLRVLETRTYRRVGGKTERTADVRFIFATNRQLPEEVRAGRFSQALYHRINVFNIELSPLRERKEDIPILTEYFMGSPPLGGPSVRISDKAMQCLMAYEWPGNIRELQNVIERGIILAENGVITQKALPRELTEAREDKSCQAPFAPLAEVEKAHIFRVLEYAQGCRSKAAELLGIGRKTLYRKLKSYEE